jgi:exonuclease SbcC
LQLANQIGALKAAAASASKTGGLCVVSRLIKCDKDFTPFLEHVRAENERISDLLKAQSQAEAVAQETVCTIKSQIATLNKAKIDTLRAAQEQQKKNDELKTQITSLERKKADLENQATLRANKHDMYVSELERLEHEPVEPVPDLDVTRLQIQGLQVQVTTLKAQIKEQADSRTTLINMQTSLLENKDAEHKYNAATTLVEELGPNGIQGEILKSGLEPLKEKIQANFDILNIKYPFAFRTESERGREIFDFGWIKNGEFVSFDTLSTGERMMVLLAVLTALLQKGTVGVRLLAIDEFQSLDSNNFANTLNGLKALYDADQLDNILIAGVLPIAELDGWNVRVLGGQEEQAVAS